MRNFFNKKYYIKNETNTTKIIEPPYGPDGGGGGSELNVLEILIVLIL